MKIKWVVQEVSTGPYRSFSKRGWPMGAADGFRFTIRCDDAYVPSLVKNGEHAELMLSFFETGISGSPTRTFKKRFATLKELKAFASALDADKLRKSAS